MKILVKYIRPYSKSKLELESNLSEVFPFKLIASLSVAVYLS